MSELSKAYLPEEVEAKWYQRWLDGGYFHADEHSDKPPFTIVIPPPNVTGSLHMGHALTNTIQDILIRYKRMSGYEALWLPGTDHAGIATQTVVERHLAKQGIDRRDLGREAFVERVWEWKQEYGDRITTQLRRLGSSLDWERERFTMDDGLSLAVREVFVRLYEQGLIYRDERLVNWDPGSQSVLSDLEVEAEEEDGFLWHIAYPVVGTEDRLVVATTRPETLVGDTAVAIHPDDPRYTHLHGKQIALPLTDRLIPIVCDPEAADMTFGSGAVKITPAHDFNDFETGRRNDLAFITVIDKDAKLNENAPERFRGLDRYEARKAMLAELRVLGLLVKEEPYRFRPGRSYRSGQIVEPLSIGKQWFVRMTPLAAPAMEAVRDGRISFLPEAWAKTYFHWMENIRDWCISRQLWWGHRIPAWDCASCGHVTVDRTDPSTCPSCGSDALVQDEDVLDTWFSSALWPFSTLGWPDDTASLKKFYPTTVMETGFDIIFFWVARMIVMGLHFMDDVPFETVFLHAMVRDKDGNKMSKSKGNVIDPLHLIDGLAPDEVSEQEREQYQMLLADFPDGIPPQGADALRFTLAVYAAAGRDIKLDVRRVEGYRAFVNKIWNAARFAQMNLADYEAAPFNPEAAFTPADRWLLTRLSVCTESVERALEEFRFSDAAQTLYEFIWHEFCDWYLELAKPTLYGDVTGIDGERVATQQAMVHTMDVFLRLLHPFMPFVTEELWAHLPHGDAAPSLCVATFPTAANTPRFEHETAMLQRVIETISGIRRVRGESNLPPGAKLPRVILFSDDAVLRTAIDGMSAYITRQAKVERVEVEPTSGERPSPSATAMVEGVEICIPLEGLIDYEAERARIHKELERVEKDVVKFTKKLGNPKFLEAAPAEIIAKDQATLDAALEKKAALLAGLERLPA